MNTYETIFYKKPIECNLMDFKEPNVIFNQRKTKVFFFFYFQDHKYGMLTYVRLTKNHV